MAQTYEDGLTPDVLEQIISAALKEQDIEGVVAALELLAVRDPDRAEAIYATIQVAIDAARRLAEMAF